MLLHFSKSFRSLLCCFSSYTNVFYSAVDWYCQIGDYYKQILETHYCVRLGNVLKVIFSSREGGIFLKNYHMETITWGKTVKLELGIIKRSACYSGTIISGRFWPSNKGNSSAIYLSCHFLNVKFGDSRINMYNTTQYNKIHLFWPFVNI